MIAQELLGPAVLVLYVGLMVGFALLGRRWPAVFRPLHGLEALGAAIERAVEAGGRVHLSLGTGSVTGADSAPAFAGLAMLSRVAAATAMSDKPVVMSSWIGPGTHITAMGSDDPGKQELETALEELQSTNEELETTNEELQSTVEELETTNEELQSTNEEHETSKEEMQSLNEELITVNAEFQGKIDELSAARRSRAK